MIGPLRPLLSNPVIAVELLIASLFANLLALASPAFVIQVLNRYVSYGVDATLATLVGGVVLAIGLEYGFRRIRLGIAAAPGEHHAGRLAIGAFGLLTTAKTAIMDRMSPGQRREILHGIESIDTATGPLHTTVLLDVPFCVLFLGAVWLLNPTLGLITLFFMGLVLLFGVVAQRQLRHPIREMTEAAFVGASLVGIANRETDTVRAFDGNELMIRAWKRHRRTLQDLRRHITLRRGTAQAITASAQVLMSVVVITTGAVLVVGGRLDVGILIGANILAARALGPIIRFTQLAELLAKAGQADQRIQQFARLSVTREGGTTPEHYRGGLAFRDLGYAWPNSVTPLFESLTLNLSPGSRLGVVGANGAGKTTLARLIVGLLEPSRGQILADGVDLRQIAPTWWRRQYSWLPQEPAFLNGTIRENLLAANPEIDDVTLNQAIVTAGLDTFIDQSPQGLDTSLIAPEKVLPLGIRRRLALARALIVGGSLVVLDEPMDGLDPSGRQIVHTVIQSLSNQDATLIVFSHDPILLRGFGQILDLNRKPVPSLLANEVVAVS
ncbi:MAG: ATP-binding cassette domain-containing protein [Gammaproteobacteria bacterium]|nr:ATP-binding cassette domain-containing protein [Gammaproteobacteria bacterium]NNJ84957.1 ATP-binding cassette domain-containing protein [Gammaproteobacteria bacterium]